ncbi:MAG: hypothetical protein K1X57_22385, partial [Gemmataceae bacterium]|nr:hypothetical protein [Gemmataceae bacterium]
AYGSVVRFTGPVDVAGSDLINFYNLGGTVDFRDATLVSPLTFRDVVGGNGPNTAIFSHADIHVAHRFIQDNGRLTFGGTGTVYLDGGTQAEPNTIANTLTLDRPLVNNGYTVVVATVDVHDSSLSNAGTLIWNGGTFRFYGTGSFTNTSTGEFYDQVDGTFGNADGGWTDFTNQGLFVKSGGDGTTTINMRLVNRGTVQVDRGRLVLSRGYVPAGPSSGPIEATITEPVPVSQEVFLSTYTQTATGGLVEQIGGAAIGQFGQIRVTDSVFLAGSLEVEMLDGFLPRLGQQFVVIDNSGPNPIQGTFDNLPEGAFVPAGPGAASGFTISYHGIAGIDGRNNDLILTPTVGVGGPYAVAEGGSVVLHAVSYTNPAFPLTYSWDLNGDGVFGDATGANPTVAWTQFGVNDGPATRRIRVRAIDGSNSATSAEAVVTVTNAPPTAAVTAGTPNAVRNESITFTLSATDFSTVDAAANFTFAIDWNNDGTDDQFVVGPSGTTVTHSFSSIGQSTVRVRATDKDGGTSPYAQTSLSVAIVQTRGNDLYVGGTAGNDQITLTRGGQNNITVTADGGAYQATFSVPGSVYVLGGGGVDTVTVAGTNQADVFDLSASVTVNGKQCIGTDVENWIAQGLGGNDRFTVSAATSATISGGTGTDTLDASLLGPCTWQVTGANAGTLNGTAAFAEVENLTGGGANDGFTFSPTGTISGTVAAGGGTDSLSFSARTAGVTVNLQGQNPTVTAASGPIVAAFTGIETVTGSAAADTLQGPDKVTNWSVGYGSVSVSGINFSGIENLKGGNKDDTFKFVRYAYESSGVSGEIDGGNGTDKFTFDYLDGDNWGGFRVDLQNGRIATNSLQTVVGHFTNVETIDMVVSSGNVLVGPNQATTWSITGNETITVGATNFIALANVVGGTGDDTFVFGSNGAVGGTITGGGGTDKLDYTAETADVVVNLTTGQADRTGGVGGIAIVTGGSGNDTLIGNGSANVLTGNDKDDVLIGGGGNDTLDGGAGQDILVGGSGADSLTGGGGDDILIGGLLSYFNETTGAADFDALN